MSQIGINAWVWTSPVTTDEFSKLVPMVARMGFDIIEIGIERNLGSRLPPRRRDREGERR